MLTIRRAIVIMIMLAIVFFIYRGISPSGADALLTNIKHIPVRLGLLSGEIEKSPMILSGTSTSGDIASGVVISTGKALVFTSTLASGGLFASDAYIFPEQEALVFTSTITSGGLFALEALVIPSQNDSIFDEPLMTGGSLVIIQDTGATDFVVVEQKPVIPTVVASKKTPVPPKKPTVPSINKDINLLNNLFK